jgi:hypothetical protein
MIVEKEKAQQAFGIYSLLDESIERDLKLREENNVKFKCYLKRDVYNIYSLVDRDYSLKCIFNEDNLKEYLAGLPSYMTFDSFESKLNTYNIYSIDCQIALKKYRFDYLLFNEKNSITFKLVCYIENFDIDFTQKSTSDYIPDNINLNPEITKKAQIFVNFHIKVKYTFLYTPQIIESN